MGSRHPLVPKDKSFGKDHILKDKDLSPGLIAIQQRLTTALSKKGNFFYSDVWAMS